MRCRPCPGAPGSSSLQRQAGSGGARCRRRRRSACVGRGGGSVVGSGSAGRFVCDSFAPPPSRRGPANWRGAALAWAHAELSAPDSGRPYGEASRFELSVQRLFFGISRKVTGILSRRSWGPRRLRACRKRGSLIRGRSGWGKWARIPKGGRPKLGSKRPHGEMHIGATGTI